MSTTEEVVSEKQPTKKVVVGALSFPYRVEIEHPYEKGKYLINDRTGRRGETIEVLDPEYQRGMRLNAFLKKGETVEERSAPEEVFFNAEDATDTDLINWIKNDNPKVQDVIDASDGDAEVAARLLIAENAATGNDPRKGVVMGLEAVIARGQE